MLSNERISQIACAAAAMVGIAIMIGLVIMTLPGPRDPDSGIVAASLGPTAPGGNVALAPTLSPTPVSLPDPATAPEQEPDTVLWKSSVMPTEEPTVEPWSTNIKPLTQPQTEQPAPTAKPKKAAPDRRSTSPRQKVRRRTKGGKYTLKSRLAEIEPEAKARLVARFKKANVAWPPSEIALIAIKDEKAVELHVRSGDEPWKHVHRYPVKAASGGSGPKLKRGDKQVPEGVYRIVYLNPNSAFHVSLRVNYPNAFDRLMARKDKRRDLGGDIMIHGKKSSAGCLAMGDPAAEELFVLAAITGQSKVKLVIAPTDFRRSKIPAVGADQPKWLPKLYLRIATEMADFKPSPKTPMSVSVYSLLGLSANQQ